MAPGRLSVALALALAACGDGAGGIDAAVAPIDAPPAAPCAVDVDEVFIMTEMRFLPEGEGEDQTGDGVIDNSLGFLAPLHGQSGH